MAESLKPKVERKKPVFLQCMKRIHTVCFH